MRRVFEKLGFEQEGILRRFMPDGDTRADYVLYAVTRPLAIPPTRRRGAGGER
jgi:RimJ/RimL family protein N-acetyltransferase